MSSSTPVVHQPNHCETLLQRLGNPIAPDWADDVRLICNLPLWIDNGETTPPIMIEFRVDSGAELSMIALSAFEERGLPVPPPETERAIRQQTANGSIDGRFRPGRIRAWWNSACQGTPFNWPILFRVDLPSTATPLLGLGGVIKDCRWIFDGRDIPGFPWGYLLLEDVRTTSR